MDESHMKSCLKIQENFYKKRIGQVFGDFEVTKVWYDWDEQKQYWELTCKKCGKTRITKNGHDYIKKRNKGKCGCEEREKREEARRLKQEDINRRKEQRRIILEERKKRVQEYISSRNYYNEEDYVGKKYGYMTILAKEKEYFICRCDCGREKRVSPTFLVRGITKSCSNKRCKYHNKLLRESTITHGKSGTRLYSVYSSMKERCRNPKNPNYKNYGGRGITVCDEWLKSFENFYSWAMENGYDENAEWGECTIDRIDVNGNYEPSNCRWISIQEQNKNKRPSSEWKQREEYIGSRMITINGETKSLSKWCRQYGVSVPFVEYRIDKKGMSPYDALTIPKMTEGRPKK